MGVDIINNYLNQQTYITEKLLLTTTPELLHYTHMAIMGVSSLIAIIRMGQMLNKKSISVYKLDRLFGSFSSPSGHNTDL